MTMCKRALGAVFAAFVVATFGVALAIETTPIQGSPVPPGEPAAVVTPRQPDEDPPPPPTATPPPLPVGPGCPNCF